MTPPSQLQLGLKLRDKGVAKVRSHNEEWTEGGLLFIAAIQPRTSFSTEHVRNNYGEPPHPNCLGALFRTAASRGLIEFAYYTKSRRPSRHASVTGVWRRRT